jgi:hypothetical protein
MTAPLPGDDRINVKGVTHALRRQPSDRVVAARAFLYGTRVGAGAVTQS